VWRLEWGATGIPTNLQSSPLRGSPTGHCSRQEAKAVAAELCPAEEVPTRTVVTAMAAVPSSPPAPAPAPDVVEPVQAGSIVELEKDEGLAGPLRAEPLALAPLVAAHRSTAEPLTAELRRLHVTVSKRFLEKLEAARDALSHSHPGADAEAILEAGLDLLIERAAARKGLVKRPRTPRKAPTPSLPSVEAGGPAKGEERRARHVPAAVRREVWLRDGGRCQFRMENGDICGSTHRLQFDHLHPVARGGESTVANLRLTCSAHNLLAARRIFGDALMDRYAPVGPSGGMAVPR
jgi:5-methylcytosine-specific restriction endonuclease McrA